MLLCCVTVVPFPGLLCCVEITVNKNRMVIEKITAGKFLRSH